MAKKNKTETNNQWASVAGHYDIKESTEKKNKTACDNQWCSTMKNSCQDTSK